MGPKVTVNKENAPIFGSLKISSLSNLDINSGLPSSFDDRKCYQRRSSSRCCLKKENFRRENSFDSRFAKQSTMNNNFLFKQNIEATQSMLMLERWFRQRLADWVQCAGHEGTILPATDRTIWKKVVGANNQEAKAYDKLMKDSCKKLVPKYVQQINLENQCYIEIEDLTKNFTSPAVMDIKLGTRTFLESEVGNLTKRLDLYRKMVDVDPAEPTAAEREECAITKLRYMQFRENQSSTSSLGFRIEAVKNRQGKELSKDFKKCKNRDQIVDVLSKFIGPKNEIMKKSLIRRLKFIRESIEKSPFFKSHELIGTSVLIMYDDINVNAWLIDFAHALPLPDGTQIDHRQPWQLGNHEDGLLTGLDNFIKILESDKLDILSNQPTD